MAGKKKPPMKALKGKVKEAGPLAAFMQKKQPPAKGGRPY